MNYKEKVDTFVSIVKEAINDKISIQIILNSELAYDVTKELYYEDKEKFEDYTEDMFDELLSENGILSVCVLCSSDGSIKLFLEEVFDTKGNTLYDDVSDFIFIEDELYDCIDKGAFEGLVVVISEHDEESEYKEYDCDNCEFNKNILEEYEEENLFKTLADELLVTIGEYAVDNKELAYEMICKKLDEAYELGKEDMQEEIQEIVENMRF
jgi:hypothetical protein